jgi:transposase
MNFSGRMDLMSGKKNKITRDFKEKLKDFLPELSKNNHHIMFLHDRISCEFDIQLGQMKNQNVISDETKEKADLINQPFPLSNEKIQFLPMFMDAEDPVYKTDMDELMSWVLKNRDPLTFFQMTKGYYAQKKSWVVQKILSLSEDFVKELNKISEEKSIPLPSLHNMYVLMTGINDFFQSEENRTLLPAFLHYPVPASIPPNQRDDRIITVWNRIYNLLAECYWVVIVMGMIDALSIVGNYKKGGLEEARNYLMHSVVYSELERRVQLIKNAQDLHSYLRTEFSVFESFFPEFGQFMKEAVVPIVKKRKKVLDFPITPLKEVKRRDKWGKEEPFSEPEPDDVMADTWNGESGIESEGPGSDDESLNQRDNGDSGDSDEKDTNVDQMVREKSIKKIPILEEFTVINGVEEKMEDIGLLKTYYLTGNPDKMIRYLFKLISNVSRTITDQIYSQELYKRHKISSSTWRRWKRKIREGGIQLPDHPDRPSGVRNINDLFEVEIQKISKDNENRRRHRGEDYFTQNELIEALQGDELRSALRNRYGIDLRKYGRTSLRNMLNRLIKENRIPVEKREGAHRFKKSDSLQIVREIANLSSK